MTSVFMAAIELLEAFEYHSTNFAPLNWDWIFQNTVPWLAIAITLTQLPHATRKADIDRARKQIEIAFSRHGDPDKPVSSTPMWQLLLQLRQQAQTQWDQAQTEQSSVSPEAHQIGAINSLPQSSGLAFTDDLMLDFGIGIQPDPVMYDDALNMQDLENLPW